ncbi:hypothetical protein CAPTEDRAFT_224983 [Capitella teleta]|uniref:Sushi domain-containing protein n=1 Tax=Capitella teleta TaxID=283909 RepID=R7V7M2_CAPTE|nr:hypothetical protein CAPTEDRAFT_224983 [Capitella teleta]|eukprot:ELU14482.1 hypothetical protein CAPTEDRAFT_224983 [Capitella teleta]
MYLPSTVLLLILIGNSLAQSTESTASSTSTDDVSMLSIYVMTGIGGLILVFTIFIVVVVCCFYNAEREEKMRVVHVRSVEDWSCDHKPVIMESRSTGMAAVSATAMQTISVPSPTPDTSTASSSLSEEPAGRMRRLIERVLTATVRRHVSAKFEDVVDLVFFYGDLLDADIRCCRPRGVKNGALLTKGPYYNESRAIYTCNNGYSMTGSAQMICKAGSWEGTRPSCSNLNIFKSTTTEDETKGGEWKTIQWILMGLAALIALSLMIAAALVCYFCVYKDCKRSLGSGLIKVAPESHSYSRQSEENLRKFNKK